MRNMIIRLVIALLAFSIGVFASAIWTLFSTKQVPFAAVKAPIAILETPRSTGCRTRAFPDPPPPPMPNNFVSGGVLNGKAISKPQPPYPPIAKAARASGTVTVQIVVDETGQVISASPVGGHPLLQQAAAQAARQARFSPTLLSGQPVKVSGVITYNFVLQ